MQTFIDPFDEYLVLPAAKGKTKKLSPSNIYITMCGVSIGETTAPIEWFAERVQNKARILIAAAGEEPGIYNIQGVGHVEKGALWHVWLTTHEIDRGEW